MLVNEKTIKKLVKFVEVFPVKSNVEFVEVNKVRVEGIRQAKQMLTAIDNNFTHIRFLSIQECGLCNNFILQLKSFLDGNDTLIRLSFAVNMISEDECYELVESCLLHPNLEILQLADVINNDNED